MGGNTSVVTVVAEGLGIDTERAENSNEIVESVSDAINSDGPTLVEIPTGPYEPQASVWRMIEGVLILLHCNHRSVY